MHNTDKKQLRGEGVFSAHCPSLWECVSISSLKQQTTAHPQAREEGTHPGSALSQLSLLLCNSRSKPKSSAPTFRMAHPTPVSQSTLPLRRAHRPNPSRPCFFWVILSWVELGVNLSVLVSSQVL